MSAWNAPEEVEAILKEKGYALERVEIDRILRPIDILTMKVKNEVLHGERVSLGEVLSLVRMHAEFTEVAMKQGFELACELFSSRLSEDYIDNVIANQERTDEEINGARLP